MMNNNYKHSEITDAIIKFYYAVYNNLGYGFLVKVYENAMLVELRKNGIFCSAQFPIEVFYNESKVGKYYADILVNDAVIVEIKAAEALCEEHENQLINYLKATEIEVGILLNFGKIPEFKRKVFSSQYKSKKNLN